MNGGHAKLPFTPQHTQRHFLAVTADGKIDARISKTKLPQDHFIDKGRQARIEQPDFI
jgi:hypothetical protein